MHAGVFINAVVVPEQSAERLCCNIGRQAAIDRMVLRVINRPAAQLEVKLEVKIPTCTSLHQIPVAF